MYITPRFKNIECNTNIEKSGKRSEEWFVNTNPCARVVRDWLFLLDEKVLRTLSLYLCKIIKFVLVQGLINKLGEPCYSTAGIEIHYHLDRAIDH